MATISGTPGNDSLTGDNATLNTSQGGTNNDSISGGAGNDTLNGLLANDTLNGDGGNDQLFGGAGSDSLYGGTEDDTLDGGAANDQLFGGAGNDYLFAGNAVNGDNDVLDGGVGFSDTVDFSQVTTGGVSFTVNSSGTVNVTYGGGGTRTDALVGIENIVGTGAADSITGDSIGNFISGAGGADVLTGLGGNDTLLGGVGNDQLFGGTGDDYLYAGDFSTGDADLLDGGAGGSDTVDFSSGDNGVIVTLGTGGNATVNPNGNTSNNTDTLVGIENIIGTNFADNITGDTVGNFLSGGGSDDIISGGGGNDTIAGGTGNDNLSGGEGSDTLTYANSASAVTANLGSTTTTGEGTDTISGFENLIGSALNDSLTGANDANLITGGAGADTIAALGGNDTVQAGAGADSVFGGAGNDTIDAGTGSDTVDGGIGDDLIYGGSAAAAGTTYITNGTFTGGGEGWTGTDLEFNPESSYGINGPSTNGVAEIDGNTGPTTVMNQSFAVDGAVSAQVTFRGVVRGDGGTVGTDGYTVSVINSLGVAIYTSSPILPGAAWQPYSLPVSFPSAGTYTLRFTEVGNNNSLGALVDDVQITSTSVVEDAADTLSGGEGNDAIFAGAGSDVVFGGTGNDNIDGGVGSDNIQAGSEDDTVLGGDGQDTILGEAGDDRILGEDGNDSIAGGIGNDALFGGNGNDIIEGGENNDTITGGIGNDTVYGGDVGNDIFIVGLNDVTTVLGDADTLTPYEVIYGGGGPGVSAGDNDTINLSAFGFSRVEIVRVPANSEDGYIKILNAAGEEIGRIDFFNIENIFPCFTPGVMILTDRGDVAVEALVPGDLVMTRDNGLQPVRWVGRRDLSLLDLMADPDLQPIELVEGALGTGPDRVMRVSPQHRMLLEGARAELMFGEAEVLVAAKHLLGHAGVTRTLPLEGVSYIHILFDRHEIVQSDGLWTESFQPANRMLSAMDAAVRDEVLSLFPELVRSADAFPAARLSLKAHEARVLLAG